MHSDSELVNAVLDGDKAAFEELVGRYERPVQAACTSVLNDRHLAADAAQEAFVSAYRKLGTLRNANTFAPWLIQIAKRCSLDILRTKRDESPLSADIHAPKTDDNHQLDYQKQILLAAVMRLPDGDREAIMLRYFDGRSVQDVADITGKSVGTITKQLSRAHAKLKTILEKT